MKKSIAVVIILLLLSTLVGCGSDDSTIKKPADVTTSQTVENSPAAKPEVNREEPQETKLEEQNDAEPEIEQETKPENEQNEPEMPKKDEKTEESTDTKQQTAPVSIQETVLVDESGVKITAKSFDEKGGFFGPSIKIMIENNSGKDLTFQCRNASVNGYMVETMMSVDVVDGKKANDTLVFMSSDLENCGITRVADMEFSFHIYDSNSWDGYLDTAPIVIRTTAADGYNYVFDDSGNLAYDGNNVRIVVKGLSDDSSWFGPSVVVYLANSGDRDITVQVRNVSVNGFMVDPMFSCDVCAGKHAIDTITFLSSDLEENDITEIEEIELSFHVIDADSWNTIVDTEIVSIRFE